MFDLVLSKYSKRSYRLETINTGFCMLMIDATTDYSAMEQAVAYMSSWNSVRIRWKHEIDSDSNDPNKENK